jgi:hypothetical protein
MAAVRTEHHTAAVANHDSSCRTRRGVGAIH